MSYNLNNMFLKPAYGPSTPQGGSAAVLAGQAITVTSTATSQFTAFNPITDVITFDVQGGSVYCTFDGTTPASGAAHILRDTQTFDWARTRAESAKFKAVSGDVVLYASQSQM